MADPVVKIDNPMIKSIIVALFQMLRQYVTNSPNKVDDLVVDILEFSLKKLKIL
jgi:CxxC motif-containing protein